MHSNIVLYKGVGFTFLVITKMYNTFITYNLWNTIVSYDGEIYNSFTYVEIYTYTRVIVGVIKLILLFLYCNAKKTNNEELCLH